MNELQLPPEAIRYIELQRTELLKNMPEGDSNQIITERYCEKMAIEAASLLHLPKLSDKWKILDIGCGIAGYHLFWNIDAERYLLDKTEIGNVYYGYKETGAYYNSLDIARKTLTMNGIPDDLIFTDETDGKTIPWEDTKFDIIVSLLSWGFHYPVLTYLDQAYDRLKINGSLIMDIRKNTGGMDILLEKFGNIALLKDSKKFKRIICTRKF